MVLEHVDEDATLLTDGEHISGRAADSYRARVNSAARFRGRVVNQIRNAQRTLASIDPDIHHGEAMTCVYRAETAECRKVLIAQGLEAADGPDQTHCRGSCVNLAYTDRDIDQLNARIASLDISAGDSLAPQPIRDRARIQAAHARTIINEHSRSCPDWDDG